MQASSAPEKRPRGSPTGDTPLKVYKRPTVDGQSRGRADKRLFLSWTDQEDCALIEFVILTRSGEYWPTSEKSSTYWDSAAEFVYTKSGSCHKRSGKLYCVSIKLPSCLSVSGTACRTRVTKTFFRKYKSPLQAEQWARSLSRPTVADTTPAGMYIYTIVR